MLPQVATAEPWARRRAGDGDATSPSRTPGLRALGRARGDPRDRSPRRSARAWRRAPSTLGDRGPSAPEHWEAGLGTGEAHVLVTVYAVDDEHLEAAPGWSSRRSARERARRRSVHEQRAEALPGGRDHFGFFDGIAQPAVGGRRRDARARATASPTAPAAGATSRTGEFLLGYVDEDGDAARRAGGAVRPQRRRSWSTASCTMDVAAFRRYIAEHGRALPRRPGAAGGQDRRPLARRHAAVASRPTRPDAAICRRPRADQRLPLRRRPAGAALPARRAHPPRQPARRRGLLRRPAVQPPPHRPPRPPLRPARCPTAHSRTTASTAAWSSSASRPTSGASSRPSRRSGSTTATRSASAPTRTS